MDNCLYLRIYCTVCRNAKHDNLLVSCKSAFVDEGFSNRRKALQRFGECERLGVSTSLSDVICVVVISC